MKAQLRNPDEYYHKMAKMKKDDGKAIELGYKAKTK